MEGFEEFDQYHSRSVKTIFVTIQRRGNFSLNRAAFKALGSPLAVKLLFNASKRQIAFRPVHTQEHRSVPVRSQGHTESYLVAGLTFCKEYDIDTDIARRYEGKMQEGVLIVDLNGPSTKATGPRLRDDVSEELQGKQQRRLARRIAEKAPILDDEIQSEINPTIQKNQEATTNHKDKNTLRKEELIALTNILKSGEVSKEDILNLLSTDSSQA